MKYVVYIPVLFLAQLLYAQTAEEQNRSCVKKTNHPPAARIKNFPFNVSGQVLCVSFDGHVAMTDNKFFFADNDPALINGSNNATSGSKETTQLTQRQIDSLTDILYNYGLKGPVSGVKTRECYDPRNAILFYNKNGRALAFIEICFECLQTRQSSTKISLGEMCDQKLDMLKVFFRNVGIKHGVN